MTISTTYTDSAVLSNGVATEFTAGFKVLDTSHIIVYHVVGGVATQKALGADYTIPTYGTPTTTVKFNSAPATGYVAMFLNAPFTQLKRYINSDTFPASSHESALDQLTQLVQQTRDRTNRYAVEYQSCLSTAFTSSISTLNPGPPGWSAIVKAGRVYRIRIFGHSQTTNALYGHRLRLTSAAAGGGFIPGTVVGRAVYQNNTDEVGQRRTTTINGDDDSGFNAFFPYANAGAWFDFEAIFRCGAEGTVSTLFATSTGAAVTVQLNVGTTFIVQEIAGAAEVPVPVP